MARQKARARGRPISKKVKEGGSEYLYREGIAAMSRIRAERAAKRWQKMLVRARRYQFPAGLKVVEHMEAALAAMERTVKALGSVPDDWRPAVGAVGGPLLEEGSAVQIREKYLGLYEFLPSTTKPLKIAKISGTRIVCEISDRSGTMTRMVFPKAHIQLTQEA